MSILISLLLIAFFSVVQGILHGRLRVPFELWILPVFRELNTFEDGARAGLCVKEAKVACPLLPLPGAFHGSPKSPFPHFPLALYHWNVLTVKSDVLHALLSMSLKDVSFEYLLNDRFRYLVQVLGHQALSVCGLHDLESQACMLGKAHLELEVAGLATKMTFWYCGWVEIEDLKRTNTELK